MALGLEYEAVVCNYVLNVLPPLARGFTIAQLASIKADRVYVTVRSHRAKLKGEPFADGVRTSIGTFQRTFTSHQIIMMLATRFDRMTLLHDKGEALIVKCQNSNQLKARSQ